MVVMRASMVEVYLTYEIMIKYHKRLCKGRTEKCILTPNLKLPKYLYKAVRSNRQFTYCSEIKKNVSLLFAMDLRGKKLLTILFYKYMFVQVCYLLMLSRHIKIEVKSYPFF